METTVSTLQIIITVLLFLLGMFSGIGMAHVWILRKVNNQAVYIAEHGRDIKTAYNDIVECKTTVQTCATMHSDTLQLVKEIINQNSILIHQVHNGNT